MHGQPPISDDLREFVELLSSHQTEFLIVGAHALALHGVPTYPSKADLVATKAAAGRPQDIADVKRLQETES